MATERNHPVALGGERVGKSNPKLIQVAPPLIGYLFAFDLVGAEPHEILTWQWMIEHGEENKTKWMGIKGGQFGVKVETTYLHRRLRAVVAFRNGTTIRMTSYPALRAEEYSRDISLTGLGELSEKITGLISEYRRRSKEFHLRRQELEQIEDPPKRAQQLEQLLDQIKAERAKMETERRQLESDHRDLAFRKKKLEDQMGQGIERVQAELEDVRAKKEAFFAEMNARREAFERDHTLRGQMEVKRTEIAAARELIERAEDAWDILDKANHLNLRLSTTSREAILRIVAAELEAAQRARREQDSLSKSNSKTCHHYALNSSMFDWAGVCADCSK